MISVTKEMKQILEQERKKRLLDSIPETVRVILSEYLSDHSIKRTHGSVTGT